MLVSGAASDSTVDLVEARAACRDYLLAGMRLFDLWRTHRQDTHAVLADECKARRTQAMARVYAASSGTAEGAERVVRGLMGDEPGNG